MQLAPIRLVPLRHARHLDVAHAPRGQVGAQLGGHITLHDLAVVQVHLHLQVGRRHGLHQAVGLVLGLQKIARHVAPIDRRNQHLHPHVSRGLRRPAQVFVGRADQGFARQRVRHQAGHDVDPRAAQHLGVVQALPDAFAKVGLFPGHAQAAAPPGLPGLGHLRQISASGRGVEQHLLQAMLRQLLRQLLGRVGIGKQVFHRPETVPGGRTEAGQERQLGVHQREVGGTAGHGCIMGNCTAAALTLVGWWPPHVAASLLVTRRAPGSCRRAADLPAVAPSPAPSRTRPCWRADWASCG